MTVTLSDRKLKKQMSRFGEKLRIAEVVAGCRNEKFPKATSYTVFTILRHMKFNVVHIEPIWPALNGLKGKCFSFDACAVRVHFFCFCSALSIVRSVHYYVYDETTPVAYFIHRHNSPPQKHLFYFQPNSICTSFSLCVCARAGISDVGTCVECPWPKIAKCFGIARIARISETGHKCFGGGVCCAPPQYALCIY